MAKTHMNMKLTDPERTIIVNALTRAAFQYDKDAERVSELAQYGMTIKGLAYECCSAGRDTGATMVTVFLSSALARAENGGRAKRTALLESANLRIRSRL
jgi:predicted N-acetyltransferase YhbS